MHATHAHSHSHGHAHSHSHGHETDSHGYETHGHGHGGENAVSHLLRDETSSNANRDDDVIAETTSWPPRDGPESTPPFPYRFRRNAELPPNAGRGLVLFVDAYTAGIAGDMFVGALLDLGCPLLVVTDALASIKNLTGFALVVTHAEKSCIVAPKFAVLESETQPLRDYRSIKEMLQTSHLSAGVKEKALAAFALLAKGEAEVHGTAIDDVHFHEVGAVDSIVDIVAVSACLDYLNCDSIEISPLPMGRGVIKGAAHGPLPSPPPAVLACLCGSGLSTFGVATNGELVTPTGACLVASLTSSHKSTRWPEHFVPLRNAYGAGSKNWRDRPNLLRLVLGKVVDL